MKRSLMTKLLACAALTVGLMGCVDSDMNMTIEGHIVPSGTAADLEADPPVPATCEIPTSAADANLRAGRLLIDINEITTSGQFPLMRARHFIFNLFITNNLSDSSGFNEVGADYNLRTDQNIIQIQRAVVSFPSDSNQGGFPDEEYEFVAQVASEGGTFFAGIPIIRPANLALWQAAIQGNTNGEPNALVPGVMEIVLEGETADGNSVTSNILTVPFDACTGCGLVSTPIFVPGE